MARFPALLVIVLLLSPGPSPAYEVTDSFGIHQFKQVPKRVVVVDWALLDQVLELGVTPIGVPEVDAYRHYVRHSALPQDTTDIGLRAAPSLDTLRALRPDLIMLGTGQKDLARPLSRIAPVVYYKSFSARYRSNGEIAKRRFLQIAGLFQQEAPAQTKLAAMEAQLAALRAQIADHFGDRPPPVTSLRLISADKLRVYGQNSLPGYALAALGLQGKYAVGRSTWGEDEVFVEALQDIDEGYLAVFLPLPEDFKPTQEAWQSLPLVQQNRVLWLPRLWSYGGAMSIGRIATASAQALMNTSR